MSTARLSFTFPLAGCAGWMGKDANSSEAIVGLNPKIAISSFLARNPEIIVSKAKDENEIRENLELSKICSTALDFTLSAMDNELSQELRKELLDTLDEHLENNRVVDYILDIILATPLPRNADIKSAIALVSKKSRSYSLLYKIIECQYRVSIIKSEWQSMRHEPLVTKAGFQNLTGTFLLNGVFRILALTGCQQELKKSKASLILANNSQPFPRIISQLCDKYKRKLPIGNQKERDINVDETFTESEEKKKTSNISKKQGHSIFQQVGQQVDVIAKLFIEGQNDRAFKYLDELITLQTKDGQSHEHVVKSLSNIANRLSGSGKQDIVLKCLAKALEFPEGCDSVLYTQVGIQLREAGQLDKSLEVFQKAASFGNKDSERIENEICKVYIAQGKFGFAIEELTRFDPVALTPQSIFTLGTAYRLSGNSVKARQAFDLAIAKDEKYTPPYAGMAVLAKQRMDFHKAIDLYDKLIATFPAPTIFTVDRSWKIYQLARCHIYMLHDQVPRALQDLERILQLSSDDANVHLGLAKAYRLMGNDAKATFHFRRAKENNISSLASDLYLAAGCKLDAIIDVNSSPVGDETFGDRFETNEVAGCVSAFQSILHSRFEEAIQITSNVNYIDKLHEDFAVVLQFHAMKMLDPQLDHRRNSAIGRIVKRGYKELRNAANCVIAGEMQSSIMYQQRLCRLVA